MIVQFDDFERLAWTEWEKIPAEYKAGVDGLIIERAAKPHPDLADVYTLGECLTESYLSDYGAPDSVRSSVVLYYGSFFRLARIDPDFEWEQELWETLTHELQHHLESLATDDSLVDMDYAADENFKRLEGGTFDPLFFRSGIREDNAYRVDDEYFIELQASSANAPLTFSWGGEEYQIAAVDADADIIFVEISGGVEQSPRVLHLVLVRPVSLRDKLRSLFSSRRPSVAEVQATAWLRAPATPPERDA